LQAASKGSASPPTQGSSVPVNVVASADADNTSMPRAAEAGGTSSDIEAAPQTQGRGTAAGDNQRLLLTTIGKVHVLSKC
jgi:ribosomal protein S5